MPLARAQYRTWVSWAAYNLGIFTIGFSTIGGTDGLASSSPSDLSFSGPLDDISDRVRRISISRGRNNNLDVMLAGSATVDVADPDGIFNPDNPGVVRNWLTNPSAENDLVSWLANGGTTTVISRDAAHPAAGKIAVKNVCDGTGTHQGSQIGSAGLGTAAAGQIWSAGVTVYHEESTAKTFTLAINQRNAADVGLGDIAMATVTVPPGIPTRISGSVVLVAATTAQLRLKIYTDTAQVVTFWADAAQLEHADSPNPYCDGDQLTSKWEGTPHASRSIFGGVLYGELDDRLHPIAIRAYRASLLPDGSPIPIGRVPLLSVAYPLFYGWVRRSVWEPHGRRATVQLECVDLFYWLERAKPIIAATGPTTTGAAIGKILDAVGLADPNMRALDVGDAIPDFSADGTQNGLALIQGLLEAERGVFFSSGAGIATYRSRLSRLLEPTVGSIADSMTTLPPGVDFDEAKTRVTVRRTQNGYTAVATASSSPLSRYAYNDLELIETPYLSSDAQADSLANWILSQVATSRIPIYGLTIDNRESSLLDQILGRDLVDRITVSEAKLKTSGDYHIDSINHEIDVGGSGRHTTTYLLTKASTVNPFIIGTSVIGGSDVFVY